MDITVTAPIVDVADTAALMACAVAIGQNADCIAYLDDEQLSTLHTAFMIKARLVSGGWLIADADAMLAIGKLIAAEQYARREAVLANMLLLSQYTLYWQHRRRTFLGPV